ncbi:MAG: Tad domain-containing protein [Planctomycetaceae bacterium]
MRRLTLHSVTNWADTRRRGIFAVVGVLCLTACLCFVAFSVDIGMISVNRTRMQNSVDSAALAAAMEITSAVQSAPQGTTNISAYARTQARQVAADVAAFNGLHVDPNTDVFFGQRTLDETTGEYTINWNIGSNDPANVVKVVTRKDNDDPAAPDAKLPLMFAQVFGSSKATMRSEAIAYVEARDMVVVHDFSRSMNFDSYFTDETTSRLDDAQVVANMQDVYNDLQPLNLGNMGFTPNYLTVSRTSPDISVTFNYASASVTSAAEYSRVKLRFTSGSEQTFNTSERRAPFRAAAAIAVKISTACPSTCSPQVHRLSIKWVTERDGDVRGGSQIR